MTTKLGRDLQVGDTIVVWWGNGRDTITALRPYRGRLESLWKEHGGARLADFAINTVGMTIEPQIVYEVV